MNACQACESLKYEKLMNVKFFGRGIRFFPPCPPLPHTCEKKSEKAELKEEKG